MDFFIANPEIINKINSDKGNATQTPFIPKIGARIAAHTFTTTKPLSMERTNAHLTEAIALNALEQNMLIPAKRKPIKYILSPTLARLKKLTLP